MVACWFALCYSNAFVRGAARHEIWRNELEVQPRFELGFFFCVRSKRRLRGGVLWRARQSFTFASRLGYRVPSGLPNRWIIRLIEDDENFLPRIHGAGLVYCDFSHGNIFISKNMSFCNMRILNASEKFGLAPAMNCPKCSWIRSARRFVMPLPKKSDLAADRGGMPTNQAPSVKRRLRWVVDKKNFLHHNRRRRACH